MCLGRQKGLELKLFFLITPLKRKNEFLVQINCEIDALRRKKKTAGKAARRPVRLCDFFLLRASISKFICTKNSFLECSLISNTLIYMYLLSTLSRCRRENLRPLFGGSGVGFPLRSVIRMCLGRQESLELKLISSSPTTAALTGNPFPRCSRATVLGKLSPPRDGLGTVPPRVKKMKKNVHGTSKM